MASDYLAAAVLSDRQTVTYRLLSREVGCTSIEAQSLLEQFKSSNSSSVHAVYAVSGTSQPISNYPQSYIEHRRPESDSQEDSNPAKSLLLQSYPAESIPVTVLKLVPQDELEKAKSELVSVSSVFVYSIGPGQDSIADLELLSVPNQKVREKDIAAEDFTSLYKYGVIPNPWAKKRSPPKLVPPVKARPASPPASTPVAQQQTTKAPAATKQKPGVKDLFKQQAQRKPSPGPASTSSTKEAPKKGPATSSIMAAFSSGKEKADARKAREKMIIPTGDDEGEEEADLNSFIIKRKHPVPPVKAPAQANDDAMDLDDEDSPIEAPSPEDIDMADANSEGEQMEVEKDNTFLPPGPAEPAGEPQTEQASTSGGRRRGRRQVTKRVRVKDEDGFLVTKEETAWESFSEDEPEPPKPAASKPALQPAKGKKGADQGPKKGQGNLLSFFKKK